MPIPLLLEASRVSVHGRFSFFSCHRVSALPFNEGEPPRATALKRPPARHSRAGFGTGMLRRRFRVAVAELSRNEAPIVEFFRCNFYRCL